MIHSAIYVHKTVACNEVAMYTHRHTHNNIEKLDKRNC